MCPTPATGFARQFTAPSASNRHARNLLAGIQAVGRSGFPLEDCGNDGREILSELPGKAPAHTSRGRRTQRLR